MPHCPCVVPAWFVPVFFSAELSLLVPVLSLFCLCWFHSCFISVFFRDKQGHSLSVPVCPFLSLSVPICPYLFRSVPVCPCLSLSVPDCPYLSLSLPVCPCLSLFDPTTEETRLKAVSETEKQSKLKYSCRAIPPKIIASRLIPRPFQEKN